MQRDAKETGGYGSLSGEDRLTTEDLARKEGGPSGDGPPAFPGEATAQGKGAPGSPTREAGEEDEPLLGPEEAGNFRSRWQAIQTDFVDDPQDAVRAADQLVAEVMQNLAKSFSAHKEDLEGQWGRGEEVVTEDLRIALQRYRSFFNRLLST